MITTEKFPKLMTRNSQTPRKINTTTSTSRHVLLKMQKTKKKSWKKPEEEKKQLTHRGAMQAGRESSEIFSAQKSKNPELYIQGNYPSKLRAKQRVSNENQQLVTRTPALHKTFKAVLQRNWKWHSPETWISIKERRASEKEATKIRFPFSSSLM